MSRGPLRPPGEPAGDGDALWTGDRSAATPARWLIVGPPGCGKSRRALDVFHQGVKTFGADACLLVLPTYGEVEHQKRLAVTRRDPGAGREGRSEVRGILDRSYATFTSLGERWVKDFRVRDLPTRRERDLLIEEALLTVDAPAFREVVDRPGLRSRVLRLVKDFKQSGDDPIALRARLRTRLPRLSTPIAREAFDGFLRVWETYDHLLVRAGRTDHEDLLRAVVTAARARRDATLGVRLLVVDGFEDLSAVETALLSAAADAVTDAVAGPGGQVIVTLPADDDARPALFSKASRLRAHLVTRCGFVETRGEGFLRATAPALQALATRLFVPQGSPGAAADAGPRVEVDDGLRTLVGADPADETDRIAREVLRMRRDGEITSWREVGVIARRLEGVGPTLARRFASLGIPARLSSGGAPLTSAGVVRALRGPFGLFCGDDGEGDAAFDPFLLLEYLRWRALASGMPFPVVEVDRLDQRMRQGAAPRTWSDLRRGWRSVGGPVAQIAADLDALYVRARPAPHAATPGASDRATDAPHAWALLVDAVAVLLPLPEGGAVDARGRPVDPEGDRRLVRARAARARLLDLVCDGARWASLTPRTQRATLREAVDDLWRSADEASAEPSEPRLDTVHLLDAEEARHWELPVVFVMGLVDGAFPLRPREDVLLRDEDRERLADDESGGVRCATAREAEDDERRFFLVAATRARRRVYLTRALTDESGRETSPSPFLGEVDAALGRGDDDPASVRRIAPGALRDAPPFDEAAGRSDLVRAACAVLGGLTAPGAEAQRALAIALVRTGGDAVASVLYRAGRFLRTAHDALPTSARDAFVASVETTSVTALSMGASCRHHFFLGQILGLNADESPLLGRAMDPRIFGSLLHEVLQRALLSPDASPESLAAAVVAAHGDALAELATRAEALDELARVVALFRGREAEAAASGFVPRWSALERAFGRGDTALEVGEGLRTLVLRGKVDRIDVGPANAGGKPRALVVDYKSGKGRVGAAAGKALLAGEDLQLPLYAHAVEALEDVEVVGLEFYAAKVRGRGALCDESAAAALTTRCAVDGSKPVVVTSEAFRAALQGALSRAGDVVEAVRNVRHEKNPADGRVCLACDARAVCRPNLDAFVPDEASDNDAGRDEAS